MKTNIKMPVLALATTMLFTACDNDDNHSTTQLDRMGRSGVNTALTDPFFRRSVDAEQSRHDNNALSYNSDQTPDGWNARFGSAIKSSIAILDSLDTNCGNQLIADASTPRYNALSGVLADDRLYVNTASGDCQQYLAVEGNAVGISNNDCGGRTPLHDTIDTTYSVLAIGALTGVDDGVPVDTDATHSLSVFPFLAAPL